MNESGLPALELAAGVATLRLRRPAQRNSLRDADLRALLALCRQLDADATVRVVVITADTQGQPRPVFCAGYHVGGFEQPDHDPGLFEAVVQAVEDLRPLTVCAMNGSVYGGACDLVLACDLRVALAGSEFRMPAAALGLHYYPSGLRRFVSSLGLAGAKRAFLTARALSVESLAALGTFEAVVPAAEFDGTVQELVRSMAALAPLAAQATKRSLNEIAGGRDQEAALRQREAMTRASADFAEGRAAFAARRPPSFTGR